MNNKYLLALTLSFLCLIITVPNVLGNTEVITNGGFESGLTGWNSNNGVNGFFSETLLTSHSGSYSANLTTNGIYNFDISQTLSISLVTYDVTFSLYYKYSAIASLNIYAVTDKGTILITNLGSQSNFALYDGSSTLSTILEINGCSYLYGIILNFGSTSTGVHSCFIDDVSLTVYLAPTPTPTPASTATPTPNTSQIIIPTYQPSPTNPEQTTNPQIIFLNDVSDNFIYLLYLIITVVILFVLIMVYMIIRKSLRR
jgi:hypothetical protein